MVKESKTSDLIARIQSISRDIILQETASYDGQIEVIEALVDAIRLRQVGEYIAQETTFYSAYKYSFEPNSPKWPTTLRAIVLNFFVIDEQKKPRIFRALILPNSLKTACIKRVELRPEGFQDYKANRISGYQAASNEFLSVRSAMQGDSIVMEKVRVAVTGELLVALKVALKEYRKRYKTRDKQFARGKSFTRVVSRSSHKLCAKKGTG